jgi:hypothetical protein
MLHSRPTRVFRQFPKVSVFPEFKRGAAYVCLFSRLKAMNVIRMIKLFGWESQARTRIAEKRDDELKWVKRKIMLNLINMVIQYVLAICVIG